MIYPVDSVDSPFEQLVLRSLWIFTRSSKDACADLQGPLKILKSFSPGSAIAIQRLNNWGQKYKLIPRCFCFACLFVFFFLLELPQTTRTKVTPASKYPIKIKVYKVVPKKISDFTPI